MSRSSSPCFWSGFPGFLSFDDFLPRQEGEVVELKEHQDEALQALATLRNAGKTIALLEHATGVGEDGHGHRGCTDD